MGRGESDKVYYVNSKCNGYGDRYNRFDIN